MPHSPAAFAADFAAGDAAAARGQEAVLHMSGLVTLRDGQIVSGRVIRDRLGLYRRLTG